MKITIDVDIDDASDAESRVFGIVADRLTAMIHESVGHKLKEQAKQEIDKAALVLIYERINTELDRVIAEGWTPTTHYGEKKGVPVTLKERISSALTEKTRENGSGYGSPEYTVIERAMKGAISEAMQKEFAEVIAEAKKRFKASLDDEMGKRLAEAVKATLLR